MKITIIGGGNIGTLVAAELANKGHDVIIYSSTVKNFQEIIDVYDVNDTLLFSSKIKGITNDLKQSVIGANFIFITYPASMFVELAGKLEKYIKSDQIIGVVPGSGGAEFAFGKIIKRGTVFFGLQRVHSIARIKEYGKSVYMLGRKHSLSVSAIPASKNQMVANMLEEMFDMPCYQMPNYLNITLTPSNPILHTSRIYSLLKNCHKDFVFDKPIMFYEDWNDNSSKILIESDSELKQICKMIPVDLSGVISLTDYYESDTVEKMTNKIKNIQAFKGIGFPMKKLECGYVVDINSRYFTADFPYGLKVLIEVARLYNVSTPVMDAMWIWYKKFVGIDKCFTLKIGKKKFQKKYV